MEKAFLEGKRVLVESGTPRREAGSLIANLRAEYGDGAVLEAIADAKERTTDYPASQMKDYCRTERTARSLSPQMQAAMTTKAYSRFTAATADLSTVAAALEKQCDAAIAGDLSRGRAMHAAHAQTLDLIFHQLSHTAIANIENRALFEMSLRLGLKAQSQCRMSLEALAEMVNPRPVYVQQANIANGGPQQVNNARVGKSADRTIGAADGQRVDGGAPATPGITHSPLETVAPIHGPADAGREVTHVAQPLQGWDQADAPRDRSSAEESTP